VVGPLVVINPSVVDAGYDHYKMIFPTVKDASQANVDSLQFADIQFYSQEDGAGSSAFLAAGDLVVAVDEIKAWNGSSYPGTPPTGESPPRVLDQVSSTKYLNFGREGSGVIITNSGGPITVGTMRLTTANDATNRDPASYELYGTNDPIQSVDNSNGLGGENWTLISSGPLSLPLARQDSSTFVPIGAASAYKSYKLIFPTLRNAPATNSMQIADIQFYEGNVPEPSMVALIGLVLAAVAVARRRA
jgi:PEP-CTERM motif